MKKLITFLGSQSKYDQYQFLYQNKKSSPTTYVQKAYDELIFNEEVFKIFILTNEAKNDHENRINKIFNNYKIVLLEPDSFGDYNWSIFRAIISEVNDGDEITIDITHGFRSTPMIVLMTINYIKSFMNQITINKVLYGQIYGTPKIVDLTEMYQLVDWAMAINGYMQTGSAVQLASMIKSKAKTEKSLLSKIAEKMVAVDDAIRLCRSDEIKVHVKELLNLTNNPNVEDEFSKEVIKHVHNKYIDFAENEVAYYYVGPLYAFNNKQIQQGITLAIENYITAILEITNLDDYIIEIKNDKLDKSYVIRELCKQLLIVPEHKLSKNQFINKINIQKCSMNYEDYIKVYNIVSKYKTYNNNFKSLSKYRNNINHAGTNKEDISSKKFYELENYLKEFKKFYLNVSDILLQKELPSQNLKELIEKFSKKTLL